MQTTKHLRITGRVQGVGYRAWFSARARRSGLAGWVRNRVDGSVEGLVSGEEHSVMHFIEECWQGPLAARVKGIEITEANAPELQDFVRLDTM